MTEQLRFTRRQTLFEGRRVGKRRRVMATVTVDAAASAAAASKAAASAAAAAAAASALIVDRGGRGVNVDVGAIGIQRRRRSGPDARTAAKRRRVGRLTGRRMNSAKVRASDWNDGCVVLTRQRSRRVVVVISGGHIRKRCRFVGLRRQTVDGDSRRVRRRGRSSSSFSSSSSSSSSTGADAGRFQFDRRDGGQRDDIRYRWCSSTGRDVAAVVQ